MVLFPDPLLPTRNVRPGLKENEERPRTIFVGSSMHVSSHATEPKVMRWDKIQNTHSVQYRFGRNGVLYGPFGEGLSDCFVCIARRYYLWEVGFQ